MAGQCGSTCPVEGGFYNYDPSVGGNAVLLAIYAALVPVVLYLGYRYRTPLFSATLTTGLLFEVLGFVGRVLLHRSRDSNACFFISHLGTVLGPTFMSTAIFLILPHILSVYGEHLCPFPPLHVGFVFYSFAGLALVLELIGVIFVAYGFNGISRTEGVDITAAGLAIQASALLAFCILHFWFTLGLSTRSAGLDVRHSGVYESPRFKNFLMAMQASNVLLLVCSIYRLVEFAGDVSGSLFQNQAAFMVIGGAFPLVATILITAFSPGAAFGSAWAATTPRGTAPRGPPEPIEVGLPIHHRYDPEIRKQISPMSQKHLRHSLSPPELPEGSPGLPPNPKPVLKPVTPRLSPTPESLDSVQDTYRFSTRPDRRSQIQNKALVTSDELW
ncbi:Fc.00g102010.m01.CDS01 [Cosmosporella sp. VM-42]